ncbi:hypothetical protein QOT17_018570 [Balamuthia mandrillaris]
MPKRKRASSKKRLPEKNDGEADPIPSPVAQDKKTTNGKANRSAARQVNSSKSEEALLSRRERFRNKVLRGEEAFKQAEGQSKRRKLAENNNNAEAKKVNELAKKMAKGQVAPKSARKQLPPKSYDIWSTPSPSSTDPVAAILAKPTPKPPPRSKPSALPAVEPASTGTSYRPTFDSHQDELGQALVEELRLQKLDRKIDRRIPRARNKDWMEGMEVQTADSKNAEEEEEEQRDIKEEEEETNQKQHNPWSTKLTKAQRNKQKRNKLEQKKKIGKMVAARKKKQLDKLPEILKDIQQTEEAAQQRALQRKLQREEAALYGTKRLGPYKFEDKPKSSEVLLTNELPSSLRQVTATVNPFYDRYRSFIKRNMIEPRHVARRRRRYRLRTYQKRSTLMPWELEGRD